MVSTGNYWDELRQLRERLEKTEAVVIGAGAGLSAAAGFLYTGERFWKYFGDFAGKYGFQDMYFGGFYPFRTPAEHWAYWSRYIYINRYMDAPEPVYRQLYQLVKEKELFVLTTNVDHCFQKAGFDKRRLFYTQGDYGLWQCSVPCHRKTYHNEASVKEMVLAQGFEIGEDGELLLPKKTEARMAVPGDMVPYCPVCGAPLTMNLRADDTFVEDAGWHEAAERYGAFLQRERRSILFLELGVGGNTPGIIKYPFWRMTAQNSKAFYVCINAAEAACPQEIRRQSLCIREDIKAVLADLQQVEEPFAGLAGSREMKN